MHALAGAAGLELLSSQARHQEQTQRSQTAAVFQRQLEELQAEQGAAESQGRRGAQDMVGIQRRQVPSNDISSMHYLLSPMTGC